MNARAKRYLIVTGDDFGLCDDANAATLDAVRRGVVRSVEIMPLAPAFAQGASALRSAPDIDVGVHLMLTSEFPGNPWRPLLSREEVPSLYDERGYCPEDVAGVRARARVPEVLAELDAQIEAVKAAGLRPTHATQHMFALDELSPGGEEAVHVLGTLAARHQLALRVANKNAAAVLAARGIPVVTHVPTDTHDVSNEDRPRRYHQIIAEAEPGITELLLHCAYDTAALRAFTTFGPRRQQDHDLAVGSGLRNAITASGVDLVSWGDVSDLARAASRTAP